MDVFRRLKEAIKRLSHLKREPSWYRSTRGRDIPHCRWNVQKSCAKCALPFECSGPSPECWCRTVTAWQPVRASATEQYGDCLCQTCLSLAFYPPSVLESVW